MEMVDSGRRIAHSSIKGCWKLRVGAGGCGCHCFILSSSVTSIAGYLQEPLVLCILANRCAHLDLDTIQVQ